jgi:hypothetical protein
MEATVQCDFCGSDIPRSDFEIGRAVTLMKKTYCCRCMLAAIERSKHEDYVPQFLTPQPGRLRSPLSPEARERPVS